MILSKWKKLEQVKWVLYSGTPCIYEVPAIFACFVEWTHVTLIQAVIKGCAEIIFYYRLIVKSNSMINTITIHQNYTPKFSHLLNPLAPRATYWRQCLCHHWSKKRLGAKSAPIHFLKQCWLLIDKTPLNNLIWNSCLILDISLSKIEMNLQSVFSCHISTGLSVLTVKLPGLPAWL